MKISQEFANDVITAAVEGGIGYWALVEAYDIDSPDTTAKIRPSEDDFPDKTWPATLDREAVQRGIDLLLDGKVKVAPSIVGVISWGVANNDAGDIDAEAADCIVQAAVLGDIIYG